MLPQFDIFRVDENGLLLWYAATETFEEAEVKAREQAQCQKCDYVIFSQRIGNRITIKPEYAAQSKAKG